MRVNSYYQFFDPYWISHRQAPGSWSSTPQSRSATCRPVVKTTTKWFRSFESSKVYVGFTMITQLHMVITCYKSVTYLSHEIAVMYHSWACLIFILIKTIHLGEVVVWPQEKAFKIPFWDTFETLFHNTKCWVVWLYCVLVYITGWPTIWMSQNSTTN